MRPHIVALAGHPRRMVVEPHAAHLLQTAGRTSADVVAYCEAVLREEPPEDPTGPCFMVYELGPEVYVALHLDPDSLLITTPEDAEPRILASADAEDEDE